MKFSKLSFYIPSPFIVHRNKDKAVYAGDIFITGYGKPGPLSNVEQSTYSSLKLVNESINEMVSKEIDMVEAKKAFKPIQKI